MTSDEAVKQFEGIKYRYMCDRNPTAAREELQGIFDYCFDAYLADASFKKVLDRAYSLLRRIENAAEPSLPQGYRYDLCYALEDMIFSANIVLSESGSEIQLECEEAKTFVNLDLKSFSYVILCLLANAVSYSDGKKTAVKLTVFDGFAGISVTSRGHFDSEVFQRAVGSDSSLGFVGRFMNSAGGSLVMTDGDGTVTVALKIPIADRNLPCTLPISVDELLYDRLSVLYIAFCGH